MVNISPIVHLQEDFFSLIDYMDGNLQIDIGKIKRRLIHSCRCLNVYVPDHYYECAGNKFLEPIKDVRGLFITGCKELANNFLNMEEDSLIFVKEEQFCAWQRVISMMPPLVLIASKIFSEKCIDITNNLHDIRHFFSRYIVPNCRYTSLLKAMPLPFVKQFLEEKGFYDLHVHINGIFESENIWQNLLQNPEENLKEFYKGNSNKIAIQKKLEQIGMPDDIDLRSLIYEARTLRSSFFSAVFKSNSNNESGETGCIHPFSYLFRNEIDITVPNNILRYECLMYVLLFNYFEKYTDCNIPYKFHKYLLIKGLFHHLLTQTVTEFGFSQFQNITLTDIREYSEKKQLGKFLQIGGNDLNYIKFAEFRFSPKESVDANVKMLRGIERDWQQFLKIMKDRSDNDCEVDYRLIAHFIKKKICFEDNKPYSSLRIEIHKKTKALLRIKRTDGDLARRIVAVDAAASEFDTPPEIFAPAFSELRKAGFKHFTYHAGEDFYHVLSGLRAIYEAVEFCELKNGDRIGHASAAGVDIDQWKQIVGESFFIPKGEWVDDLLFAYFFILEFKITDLETKLPVLSDSIIRLYTEIFEKSYAMPDIISAWKEFRKKDLVTEKNLRSDVEEINEKYQNMKFRKQYIAPLQINSDELFTAEELILLQKKVLEYLHEREIVIEVLPTSNLRIGYHFSLHTYQLFTWYKWQRENLPVPPIVLGTDDPGIFATNIYNEYVFVYCFLVYEKKQARSDVIQFIHLLCENSRTYAFF